MKIAVASDHRGYHLKEKVIALLKSKGHEVVDEGPATDESVDYPDFAALVASQVSNGTVDRGYWQINSIHGVLSTYDAAGNARAAVQLSGDGTDWSPWVTYATAAYQGQC